VSSRTQEPGGEEQQRADKSEDGFNQDKNEPKGQGKQPQHGQEQEQRNGQWPAENRQDSKSS